MKLSALVLIYHNIGEMIQSFPKGRIHFVVFLDLSCHRQRKFRNLCRVWSIQDFNNKIWKSWSHLICAIANQSSLFLLPCSLSNDHPQNSLWWPLRWQQTPRILRDPSFLSTSSRGLLTSELFKSFSLLYNYRCKWMRFSFPWNVLWNRLCGAYKIYLNLTWQIHFLFYSISFIWKPNLQKCIFTDCTSAYEIITKNDSGLGNQSTSQDDIHSFETSSNESLNKH